MKQFPAILLAFFCLAFSKVNAQVDIKINPLGPIVFDNINLSVEFGVADNFGIEIVPGYGWDPLGILNSSDEEEDFNGNVFRLMANGRYYLNPSEKGLNGFYIGAFSRYKGGFYSRGDDKVDSKKLSLGFILGTKIVSRNEKLVFDFGTGLGRALLNKYTNRATGESENVAHYPFFNSDALLFINVGYRISGGK